MLGFRVNDVLKELTKEVNEKAKYEIKKHKEHYYIKDFYTKKENVKIRYVFFPKELTKLIQSIYSIKDLTKLDLSKDFLKGRNNTLINSTEYMRKLKKVVKELYPKEVMRTHSFRKYFSTRNSYVNLCDYSRNTLNQTIGSEVESNFKEHLLGHRVHYSSKVYNQILNSLNNFYELWKPLEVQVQVQVKLIPF